MDKLWITILVLLGLNIWQSYLLFKKPTTENNVKNLNQKNKRNKGSNIDNDISAKLEQEKPRKRTRNNNTGILNRIRNKRLTKKQKR